MKKRYLPTLVLVLLTCLATFAQDDGLKLVDELPNTNREEILARIDGLAHDLKESSPDSRIVITISGPKSSLSARYTKGATYRAHLEHINKISPDRIKIMPCATDENYLHTRFYIASPTAKLPECDESLPKLTQTTLFGSAYFSTDLDDDCCIIPGEEQERFKVLLQTASDLLAADEGSKVILIGYGGTNNYSTSAPGPKRSSTLDRKPRGWDSPSVANEKLREATNYLNKQHPQRQPASSLFGGYRDGGSVVEIWIIPAGGTKPEIKPVYRIRRQSPRGK